MDPVTITAIAVFLAPYLQKAGQKVAEKTIETLFDNRKDLAEKFTGLFQTDIISLGLNNAASAEEIAKQLSATPQVKQEVGNKIENNQDLLTELVKAFKQSPQPEFQGIEINAKNIGAVINNPSGPIRLTNKFS